MPTPNLWTSVPEDATRNMKGLQKQVLLNLSPWILMTQAADKMRTLQKEVMGQNSMKKARVPQKTGVVTLGLRSIIFYTEL